MKRICIWVLTIIFAFALSGCNLGGCSVVSRQIQSYADKKLQVQKQLAEINQLLDKEEFDKAFEQSKAIVNNPMAGVESMNGVAVKFLNKS